MQIDSDMLNQIRIVGSLPCAHQDWEKDECRPLCLLSPLLEEFVILGHQIPGNKKWKKPLQAAETQKTRVEECKGQGAARQSESSGDEEIADYWGAGAGTPVLLTVRGPAGLPAAAVTVSTGAVVYQLSLITNTPTEIYAGGDITDLLFFGENYSSSDITSIIAGDSAKDVATSPSPSRLRVRTLVPS